MKKKSVIFTIAIGERFEYFPTLKYMEKYSDKCGCDFYCLTSLKVNYINEYFEKFYFIELLKKYERVLYLDCDILITPNANNIFSNFPESEFVYAFHENNDSQGMNRDPLIHPLLVKCNNWPYQKNGKLQYFNSGVFLVSKENMDNFLNFKEVFEDLQDINFYDTFGEQTFLNYLIVKNGVRLKPLPYSYNRIGLRKDDPNSERYYSNFIHYAGKGYFKEGDHDIKDVIERDIDFLYGKK